MFNIFITIFWFFTLYLPGAYAKTENDFKKHLNCFKVLDDKTYSDSDKLFSGYLKTANVAIFPYPSMPDTWLIVTESSIYQHSFYAEETILSFSSRQIFFNFDPDLNLLRVSETIPEEKSDLQDKCGVSFRTISEPHETTDDTARNLVRETLAKRIITVYEKFSSFSKTSPDKMIDALNRCKGIDVFLDYIIGVEKNKFYKSMKFWAWRESENLYK